MEKKENEHLEKSEMRDWHSKKKQKRIKMKTIRVDLISEIQLVWFGLLL